jgi:hypothetical protein
MPPAPLRYAKVVSALLAASRPAPVRCERTQERKKAATVFNIVHRTRVLPRQAQDMRGKWWVALELHAV